MVRRQNNLPPLQGVCYSGVGSAEFEKLILATGARPRTSEIPGANLENIQFLRSSEELRTIRQRAEAVKRAAVIGGGFIAKDVAAVLSQKGH